jgi:hypothetical protein
MSILLLSIIFSYSPYKRVAGELPGFIKNLKNTYSYGIPLMHVAMLCLIPEQTCLADYLVWYRKKTMPLPKLRFSKSSSSRWMLSGMNRLPPPTRIGTRNRQHSSINPDLKAWAARSGPPIRISCPADAFNCLITLGSKFHSMCVLFVETASNVREYTILSAARHICANSRVIGDIVSRLGSVSHAIIISYVRRPKRWLPDARSRLLIKLCTSSSGIAQSNLPFVSSI